MSEQVIDIGEDRRRMEVRLQENLNEMVEGCFYSHSSGLSAVWLVEHLRHTGQ